MNPIGGLRPGSGSLPTYCEKKGVCYQDQRLISSFDIILDNLFYEFLNRAMLYI